MSIVLALPKVAAAILAVALFLILSHSVLAEDATSPSSIKKDRIQTSIEDKRAQLQTRREELATSLEQRRAEIASKAAQLKVRLQRFKDQVKAKIVERINTTLDKINQKQTEQMKKHLDKMSQLLAKVETRVNEASASGQNTASASAAVNSAREAIASASAAVDKQMGNDYTIKVSSESAVRVDAKKARDALHKDLREVRSLVIAAKQAVANAIRVTAQTLKGLKFGQQ